MQYSARQMNRDEAARVMIQSAMIARRREMCRESREEVLQQQNQARFAQGSRRYATTPNSKLDNTR